MGKNLDEIRKRMARGGNTLKESARGAGEAVKKYSGNRLFYLPAITEQGNIISGLYFL